MTKRTFAQLPIGTRFLDALGVMWLKLARDAAQCVDAASTQYGTVHIFAATAEVYTA